MYNPNKQKSSLLSNFSILFLLTLSYEQKLKFQSSDS